MNGFIELGEKYLTWYLADQFTLEMLAGSAAHRQTLTEVYKELCNSHGLCRLEKTDYKTKTEIWNDCKPFVEKLSNEEQVKFCKAYWALSFLAKKRTS